MQFVIQFLARMQGQILQPQRRQSRGGRQLKDQVLAIKLKGHRGEHARVDELLRPDVYLRVGEIYTRFQIRCTEQIGIGILRRPANRIHCGWMLWPAIGKAAQISASTAAGRGRVCCIVRSD